MDHQTILTVPFLVLLLLGAIPIVDVLACLEVELVDLVFGAVHDLPLLSGVFRREGELGRVVNSKRLAVGRGCPHGRTWHEQVVDFGR